MTTLEAYLEKNADRMDKVINRYFGDVYGDLFRASAHLLLAGGKRLRPAVVILAADAVKEGSSDDLIPAALALELTHNFTLIHDDIMDGDVTRRGVPTVHTIWGEPTAILAGDVLYAKAFEFICLSDAGNHEKVHAVKMLARTCTEICEGQSMDIAFAAREDVSEAEYLEMVSKKTGVLYGAAAAIGGILAGANPIQADALYQFGVNSGIAFQIQDDLIDLYASSEESGKDRASDIREGKQTLIAIKARQKGLDLAPYRRDLSGAEIDGLIARLEDAGVIDEVRATAVERAGVAKAALSVLPDSEEKRLLGEIADFFINRGF
ncbi:MAG TPA: polyprenyl synthetase family protein [Candidatus Methanoculleus thermohydrogenotrophicum]|jgi:geranylgeranyl diphosphate synthase type I|nr:polyprenyl synthetase family protein [Candidatus Methanoculleus thermohydrogenotrophicum]NLM81279.1 polyprenyl synthetase family protein [Candidatus Methanoculleus thermohydrogenotrophicum]HOB17387.1 polyprenyl synthetase family protein [Candidatus Methanoculleus thermohydrogenotrophicum]HPZ37542.1 polyprenyl synthetase family protein [Candidatus Methanoculleus thermohydrogenotrophicum]HQC90994.1 polyprenyl synthetase family protein [Candidatus Methanoculleus thermohydrogenotrophicum]